MTRFMYVVMGVMLMGLMISCTEQEETTPPASPERETLGEEKPLGGDETQTQTAAESGAQPSEGATQETRPADEGMQESRPAAAAADEEPLEDAARERGDETATAEEQTIDAPQELAEGTDALVAAETVTLEAKNGNVTFSHREHGQMFGCDACHTGETPTLLELDMNSAHKLCRGCHEDQGAGPTKCADCHKK